jgi:hypothetical protein
MEASYQQGALRSHLAATSFALTGTAPGAAAAVGLLCVLLSAVN